MTENEQPRRYRKALRLKEVMERTGVRRSFIYREMAAEPPRFPLHGKAGHASIWDADEIDAWLAARLDRKVA